MNSPEILVIDDEVQICKLLQLTLQADGYNVRTAHTGNEGIQMLVAHRCDVVLLDIGLPDKSGQEVLYELRQWYDKPILILSVQNTETDIVEALDNGANDYLVKPFRAGELLARIRTALRHSSGADKEPVLQFGNLVVDIVNRRVTKAGETVKLTQTEYNLLVLFVQNEGKALTHKYLLKNIWGAFYAEQTQYLRVFIAQLRKKIEEDINQPRHIITESGVGYRFAG
ncbi:MAG: response regulator [Chitinophagaceae bacterium]|nr:response regulator [Chitinophagaceae bacterium]MCB9046842.1 response regulator [Chitinophagales bacterium]